MPGPPLGFPPQITISKVAPGSSGTAGGGNTVRADGDVLARLNGDAFGVFSIDSIETLELVSDPDAHGERVWETVATVNGSGPIRGGEAIMVTARFSPPLVQPQDTYHAVIEVVANTTQAIILSVSVTGNTNPGTLSIAATSTPPMFAGDQSTFHFRLNSTLRQQISGVFTCDPAPGDNSPFRSDIQPQLPTIAPGSQVEFDLPVSCPANTAPGEYNVLFGLKAIGDSNFLFSQRIPVTVKSQRSVQVISSLLPDVNLAQGDSVLCELRFIVSGGPGVLSLSPGAVPFGVSLENAQETVNVDGEFLIGVNINIDPQAPLNTTPTPLTLNYNVAGDALHDAVNGTIAFNLRILAPEPAELPFDIDSITFDDSTPANGDVHAVFRRDGTFNCHGHFHNSGAIDLNYNLVAGVLDANGNLYTMLHSGRVAGSLAPGSPDDNFNEEDRNDAIAQNWVVLLAGGNEFRCVASTTTDFANITVEALGIALGIAGVVLGVIALIPAKKQP
jgi:hypothetical protein